MARRSRTLIPCFDDSDEQTCQPGEGRAGSLVEFAVALYIFGGGERLGGPTFNGYITGDAVVGKRFPASFNLRSCVCVLILNAILSIHVIIQHICSN